MSASLSGKHVAILAADGFEQSELLHPKNALQDAGATVDVVSLQDGDIQGFKHLDPGETVTVDKVVAGVSCADYDGLVIPGGLFNPDALRTDEAALDFVRGFFQTGKVVGAICHGPWVLINAGVVKGRQVTSVSSIRKDLENAGAHWSDIEVMVDMELVTSRTPDDLEAFSSMLIEKIGAAPAHRESPD